MAETATDPQVDEARQSAYEELRRRGAFNADPTRAAAAQELVKRGLLRDASGGSNYTAPTPAPAVPFIAAHPTGMKRGQPQALNGTSTGDVAAANSDPLVDIGKYIPQAARNVGKTISDLGQGLAGGPGTPQIPVSQQTRRQVASDTGKAAVSAGKTAAQVASAVGGAASNLITTGTDSGKPIQVPARKPLPKTGQFKATSPTNIVKGKPQQPVFSTGDIGFNNLGNDLTGGAFTQDPTQGRQVAQRAPIAPMVKGQPQSVAYDTGNAAQDASGHAPYTSPLDAILRGSTVAAAHSTRYPIAAMYGALGYPDAALKAVENRSALDPANYDANGNLLTSPDPSTAQRAALGAAGRAAIPAASGLEGATIAAEAASPFGPLASTLAGVGGAVGGTSSANWLQDQLTKAALGKKLYGRYRTDIGTDAEQHPIATLAGETAPMAALFNPDLPTILKPSANRLIGAGIGLGQEGYNQIRSGKYEPGKLGTAAGSGYTFAGGETPFGESIAEGPRSIGSDIAEGMHGVREGIAGRMAAGVKPTIPLPPPSPFDVPADTPIPTDINHEAALRPIVGDKYDALQQAVHTIAASDPASPEHGVAAQAFHGIVKDLPPEQQAAVIAAYHNNGNPILSPYDQTAGTVPQAQSPIPAEPPTPDATSPVQASNAADETNTPPAVSPYEIEPAEAPPVPEQQVQPTPSTMTPHSRIVTNRAELSDALQSMAGMKYSKQRADDAATHWESVARGVSKATGQSVPDWYRQNAGRITNDGKDMATQLTDELGNNPTTGKPYDLTDKRALLIQTGFFKPNADGTVSFDRGFKYSPENARRVLIALTKPNVSTSIHELGHILRQSITDPADRAVLDKWAGVKDGVWTTKHEELFAQSFERWVRSGAVPHESLRGVFGRFADALKGIYSSMTKIGVTKAFNPDMVGLLSKYHGDVSDVTGEGNPNPFTREDGANGTGIGDTGTTLRGTNLRTGEQRGPTGDGGTGAQDEADANGNSTAVAPGVRPVDRAGNGPEPVPEPAAATEPATTAAKPEKQSGTKPLVLTRNGDYWQATGRDARTIAKELGLTLQSPKGDTIGMNDHVGIPDHALERYTSKLAEKGYDVSTGETAAKAAPKARVKPNPAAIPDMSKPIPEVADELLARSPNVKPTQANIDLATKAVAWGRQRMQDAIYSDPSTPRGTGWHWYDYKIVGDYKPGDATVTIQSPREAPGAPDAQGDEAGALKGTNREYTVNLKTGFSSDADSQTHLNGIKGNTTPEGHETARHGINKQLRDAGFNASSRVVSKHTRIAQMLIKQAGYPMPDLPNDILFQTGKDEPKPEDARTLDYEKTKGGSYEVFDSKSGHSYGFVRSEAAAKARIEKIANPVVKLDTANPDTKYKTGTRGVLTDEHGTRQPFVADKTGRMIAAPKTGVDNETFMRRRMEGIEDDAQKPKDIARGQSALIGRINFESRVKGLDPDIAEAAIDFIRSIPAKYTEHLGMSAYGGKGVPNLRTDKALGSYNPTDAIAAFARLGVNESSVGERTIPHEVSHHLEQFVPDNDYRALQMQFKREQSARQKPNEAKADDLYKQAEAAEKAGNREKAGELHYQAGMARQHGYRYTSFQEWFAENIVDKAMRDMFPPESAGTKKLYQRVAEHLKGLLSSVHDWLIRRGQPDMAESVYKRFMGGKYDATKQRNFGEGNLPMEDKTADDIRRDVIKATSPGSTQKRAATGGEVGANSERYSGGQFIATSPETVKGDMTKTRKLGENNSKAVEVEPGKREVLPLGMAPLFKKADFGQSLSWPQDGKASIFEPYIKLHPELRAKAQANVDAWNRGERTVDLTKSPELAHAGDIARFVHAKQPIPDGLMARAKQVIPGINWEKWNALTSPTNAPLFQTGKDDEHIELGDSYTDGNGKKWTVSGKTAIINGKESNNYLSIHDGQGNSKSITPQMFNRIKSNSASPEPTNTAKLFGDSPFDATPDQTFKPKPKTLPPGTIEGAKPLAGELKKEQMASGAAMPKPEPTARSPFLHPDYVPPSKRAVKTIQENAHADQQVAKVKPTLRTRIGAIAEDIQASLRTLKVSGNLHYVLRHGAVLGANNLHNGVVGKAVFDSYRAAKSPEAADTVYRDIVRDPMFKGAMDAGVKMDGIRERQYKAAKAANANAAGIPASEQSEDYGNNTASKVLAKIPGLAHADRANQVYIDSLRFHAFKQMAKGIDAAEAQAKTAGKPFNRAAEMSAIARFTNYASGKGDLTRLGVSQNNVDAFTKVARHILLSPTYGTSRIQLATELFRNNATPAARKIIVKNTLVYAGAVAAAQAIAATVFGAKNEKPGRIAIGNKHIDLTAGAERNVEVLTKTASYLAQGRVEDARDAVAQYMRNGFNPGAGLISDAIAPQYAPDRYDNRTAKALANDHTRNKVPIGDRIALGRDRVVEAASGTWVDDLFKEMKQEAHENGTEIGWGNWWNDLPALVKPGNVASSAATFHGGSVNDYDAKGSDDPNGWLKSMLGRPAN